MTLVLSLVVYVRSPHTAEAGIFSGLFKLFSSETDAEELRSSMAFISVPLMGSGVTSRAVGGPDLDEGPDDSHVLLMTQDSALVGTQNPIGTLLSDAPRGEILVYTVLDGDVPGAIAARFGITLNTLLWANNLKNSNLIRPGDKLVILPVSGVKYTVKQGDTIGAIARVFKGDIEEILRFNGLAIDAEIKPGEVLIIPNGELPSQSPTPLVSLSLKTGLPAHDGYYVRPIQGGKRSRGIHGYNAVDLASTCGLPVFAAASGQAIVVRLSGWNGGYGIYLVVSHPNGTQTLYGHMSGVAVAAGANIAQGEVIGAIGSTGNSTGCHVHFEVRGARNPF